jgi:hypothetical protein
MPLKPAVEEHVPWLADVFLVHVNGPRDWSSQLLKNAGPRPRIVSPSPTIRLSVTYAGPFTCSASPDP